MTVKKHIMRAVCAALALLAALFAFTACGGTPEEVEARRSNVLVVEHIDSADERVSGTCFVVSSDERYTYALTNYHVVTDAPDGITVGSGADERTAELVGYYEYHDIAVICWETGDAEYDTIPAEAFVAAEEGKGAWSTGNEHGRGKLITDDGKTVTADAVADAYRLGWYAPGMHDEGLPDGKSVPVVEYTCSVESGMSGCPIMDKRGNIIGVGAYRSEDSSHYYGVDARIAYAVYEAAVIDGTFCEGYGSLNERGKEVDLSGSGNYYRLFLADNGTDYDLVFYGRYNDWGASTENGGTVRYYHDIGFSARITENGLFVTGAGGYSPLKGGETITAIDGTDVRGMSYADIMVMFYDGYRLTETEDTSSAIKLTLSGGGEVTLAGNGCAVTKKA